jgi:hypothetical protein
MTEPTRRAALGAILAAPAVVALGASAAMAFPTADTAAWDVALADYRAKRSHSDAMPLGAPGEDDAVDAYCAAMDHLINKVPAPTLAAVVLKLELAVERETIDGYDEALLADLRRFAAREA